MSSLNQFLNNNLPIWQLMLAALVACFLNYYSVSLFTGIELIFGNVIAVIILFTYGVLPAAFVALAAGIAAYLGFGDFFIIPLSLFEILALHWALKTQRNPLYVGMLFWVFIGVIFISLKLLFFSGFELSEYSSTILNNIINGLLNILIGYSLAQFILQNNWLGIFVNKQRILIILTNQLYLILSGAVTALSFFWLIAFEREMLSDYQHRLQVKADHISHEVSNQIDGHRKSLILSILNNNNITDPLEIQKTLSHLKNIYPAITTLLSADKDGNLTAAYPPILLTEASQNVKINVADRDYFSEVKKTGKPFVSDVFKGRGFGSASIIAISAPLKNDAGFVGIIEMSLDIALLNDVDENHIGPKEGLIILDRNNRVIYASDTLNYEFLIDLSDSKLIKHLSMQDRLDLEDQFGNHLLVESAKSELLGWTIISTLPMSVYQSQIHNYATITLCLLGLFIVFSFYLVRSILRKVTKPINTLSYALNKAKNAEDLVGLKLHSGKQKLVEITKVEDKLTEFAVRSKQLMSDLKQAKLNQDLANEQLLDLNGNLEKIVDSKTKELNDALKIANEANDVKDQARKVAEQAARGKTEFLATMSHEIRTPMNGVLGMAELLNETQLTVTQKDYVESILNSGNLLRTIVNDVLVYSKLEAGKVELEIVPMDLEHLLHEVLDVMSGSLTKNIDLVLDYPPTMPTIFMGDPARLSQVVFNLVDNAIKFTEQGSVSIQASFSDGFLTIVVKDTGIGITQEQQNELFKSFNQADTSTTRKYGGTGLGLAITKQIIHLMNGTIKVESEFNEGSRFIINLMLTAEKDFERVTAFNNLNILLIESDERQLKIYSNLLSHFGANVIPCVDFQSALQSSRQVSEDVMLIDIVLISNGSLLAQENSNVSQLRNHLKLGDIPFVVMSPSYNKQTLEYYFDAGFTAYITKPIRSNLLISILKATLEKKNPKELITKYTLPNHSKTKVISNQFSGHILLVEDVLTNQVIATRMLTNLGLTVDLAKDGVEAITKWQNHNYDLIFMDCRMPNMDGYQATKLIREKETDRKIPIIALTANVTEEDRTKCYEAGMDAVVMKPYKPADLSDALSKWLNGDSSFATTSETVQIEPISDNGIDSHSAGAIDVDAFKETQQLLGDSFPELVESIFSDFDKILERLSNWSSSDSMDDLVLLPHSMKSSSAYIGAKTLNQLAVDCEIDARKGDVQKTLSYVEKMKSAYEDVTTELAKLGYTKPSS